MAFAPIALVSVASDAYPTTAQLDPGFTLDSVLVVNRSAVAADVVMVSFDGVNDHARLVPGTPTAAISYEIIKVPGVWLRQEVAGAAISCEITGNSR